MYYQIFDTRAVLRGLEALCIRWGTCGVGEGHYYTTLHYYTSMGCVDVEQG